MAGKKNSMLLSNFLPAIFYKLRSSFLSILHAVCDCGTISIRQLSTVPPCLERGRYGQPQPRSDRHNTMLSHPDCPSTTPRRAAAHLSHPDCGQAGCCMHAQTLHGWPTRCLRHSLAPPRGRSSLPTRRSAPGTIATVFVNSHRLVIDSLRNLKENWKIFKEKSHPCGGFFYVKNP